MNRRACLAIALLATAVVSPAYTADLLEVYQRAAQNDPLIREAEANRLAALEAKPRALSQLLPQLDAAGRYDKTNTDGGSTFPQRLVGGNILNVPSTQETDSDTRQYPVPTDPDSISLGPMDDLEASRRAGRPG